MPKVSPVEKRRAISVWIEKVRAGKAWQSDKFKGLRGDIRRLKESLELGLVRPEVSKNIPIYGKRFITTFLGKKLKRSKGRVFSVSMDTSIDSPVAIILHVERTREEKKSLMLVSLGFEKNAVTMRVQGFSDEFSKGGTVGDLDRFRQKFNSPGANYLVSIVERHAKKCGFEEAKIRDPTTLYYYKFPALEQRHGFSKEEIKAYRRAMFQILEGGAFPAECPNIKRRVMEIRANMRRFYKRVADAKGYRKKGEFYVKKL
jgi:hypothetical protein